MPRIKAPEPFTSILRAYIREGRHPGNFIERLLIHNNLTEACALADDHNAESLWHIGAIIREYVPSFLRNDMEAFQHHMVVMQQGSTLDGFIQLSPDDQELYNYYKGWDIPDYVPRIAKHSL